MKYLLLALSLIIISCGKSPILDHVHEKSDDLISTTHTLESKMFLKSLDIQISHLWLKGPFPSSDKESNILFILKDKLGNLVNLPEDHTLIPEGWMDSMGHGTAYDGYIENNGQGTYLNKELFFNMAGDWTYTLYLYKGEELIDKTQMRFEF
jgi:hypothetical protein